MTTACSYIYPHARVLKSQNHNFHKTKTQKALCEVKHNFSIRIAGKFALSWISSSETLLVI